MAEARERGHRQEFVVDWELDEVPEPSGDQGRLGRGLGGVEVRWEALCPGPPRRGAETGDAGRHQEERR